MRVEQKIFRHRSSSRPLSASGSTSSAGLTRSTPSPTVTDPGCAPNREPARASCSSRSRTARATASVLLPSVNFSAASSIRATTSGRLIVTTLATAGHPHIITYIMISVRVRADQEGRLTALQNRFGYDTHRCCVGAGQKQRADPVLFCDVLPGLQPVADPRRRADQRNFVDQRIGHRGSRLVLLAVEIEVLDFDRRRLV